MENNKLNVAVLEVMARNILHEAFAGFASRETEPDSWSVAAVENIEESGWAGKWTEDIRNAVRVSSPSVERICVKPIPWRGLVWYTVKVR